MPQELAGISHAKCSTKTAEAWCRAVLRALNLGGPILAQQEWETTNLNARRGDLPPLLRKNGAPLFAALPTLLNANL